MANALDRKPRRKKEDPVREIHLNSRGVGFFGLAFASFGLIFFTLGLGTALSTSHSLQGTLASQGRIVSCKIEQDTTYEGDPIATCRPTVRFNTASGQEIDFIGTPAASWFQEGEEVSVRYHPDDPSNALISDFSSLWFSSLFPGGIGLVFVFVGLSIFIRRNFDRGEIKEQW